MDSVRGTTHEEEHKWRNLE